VNYVLSRLFTTCCKSFTEGRIIVMCLMRRTKVTFPEQVQLFMNLIARSPNTLAERSKTWVICRLLAWDFEFESHRGHRCLSVLSVVCCQVEFSVSD
jgi:hypothetical protein